MKCIATAVLMAVILAAAQAQYYYPYPYYAPAAVATAYAPPGSTVVQAYVPPNYYAPAVYVSPPVVVAPGGARYTAVNPGAVHDAPLPGHTVSQQSLNTAPAPGTG
ncbi:hypothetical protein RP20_CCG001389 [Aedes albopictus]|nr:adult cuticle protein 1-like [Aedes albopictus]KXJ83804.1 hypothetical protein RP20_CCG001389 [Aedes albopictus]